MIKTYKAKKQSDALRQATLEAEQGGYEIESYSWQEGKWGCMAFIIALLLCFVLVGILAFIYLLIVKPKGELTVVTKEVSTDVIRY